MKTKKKTITKQIRLNLNEAAFLRHIRNYQYFGENVILEDKDLECIQPLLENESLTLYLTYFGIDFQLDFSASATKFILETLQKKNKNHI